ncbi:MAG: aminomethyl-transferring glycine dehydrogenase subunit GcvPA [Hyphomicrobiaceae bacterium]|nr:aminomethyl-transferring glycine dehydrogenase subunit GcvPA [Hyphomicrobiaceae bacterium]
MSFVPHSEAERAAMLARIGVPRMETLFDDVPQAARFPALELPAPISQLELEAEMRALADTNAAARRHVSFLGAGSYAHFRPATVDAVLRRGEMFTSYTPYQPELSQGMLQAMFEYQTMICRLTGMDVATASHYDGATALAEAVFLALAAAPGQRKRVLVSSSVHPHVRAVLATYLAGTEASLVDMRLGEGKSGEPAPSIDATAGAVVLASPNVFGQLEDVAGVAARAKAAGALLVVVTDPIALGLFAPPGAQGADVVVADGQCLGLPPSFGGPSLGIFATRQAHVRRLPGRLVGETTDGSGRRGYVLTLGTREQHIRRARATSNICTNAALGALAASVYLATLGRHGLRRVAELCYHKCHYAAAQASRLPGVVLNPQAPDAAFFKEFVLQLPLPVAEVNAVLLERYGIIGGLDLGTIIEGLSHHMLVAVTEMASRGDIDRFVTGLAEATR